MNRFEDFTFVVMSHNRFDFLSELLESIRRQTLDFPNVVISDNSSTKEHPLKTEISDSGWQLIEHCDLPSSALHFNWIINHIEAPHLMIFHDDDILTANFFEMVNNVIASTFASVYCVKAKIFKSGSQVKPWGRVLGGGDRESYAEQELANDNLSSLHGSPAFSSLIYSRCAQHWLRANFDKSESLAGKYNDLVLCANIARELNIKKIPNATFFYRVGVDSVSNKFDYSTFKLCLTSLESASLVDVDYKKWSLILRRPSRANLLSLVNGSLSTKLIKFLLSNFARYIWLKVS